MQPCPKFIITNTAALFSLRINPKFKFYVENRKCENHLTLGAIIEQIKSFEQVILGLIILNKYNYFS